MLEDVKGSLRINTDNPQIIQEIQDLIEAARFDLIQSGVSSDKANDDNDPLIKRAITTYCKAHFGYDNPDADRLSNAYNMLKQHLSLAGDYNEVE